METPTHDDLPTPAQQALDALVVNAEDQTALDTLAHTDVLVPVPDDAVDGEGADATTVALPILEQPGGDPVVPVFTTEGEMTGLLPFVSRYRLIPLGALASQWPEEDLSLAIDGNSAHALTLTSQGVRTLLAR
ncbi:SseB family protein [Streptomyces sp. LP11]|uniref:SseB family protein n=1 Tax=Streptomyces pyxinicus TaxID=2970331 RepID=A0ABT2B7C7_9ACTN|nr:SseB family protein [Streptomyces sp. LP11]MCS0603843.1 SseB family protein [Streptomyces sp. LP11]